jgi:predicted enzyme related to lactoylglutathione lyase
MIYEHKRFVWFELLTNDIEKAKSFYPEVLPWRIEPTAMQDGSSYNLIKVGDQGVGGLMSPQGDAPTAWISYVSVANVDETAKKIKAAGGAAQMDAFDAPGVGRMQPVSDAQGGARALCTVVSSRVKPAIPHGSYPRRDVHAKRHVLHLEGR